MANSFFSGKNNIFIPLILAAVGVFLITQYLRTKEGELGLSAELIPVMVANADIATYTKVDKSMFHSIEIPKKFVQPSSLKNPDEIDGRVSLIPILKGEQILTTMLSGAGQSAGLALKIRPGYRAVSVGVDAISGVSGLLRPGDKVDVLGTFDLTSENNLDKRTFTLIKDITVLAVGEDLGAESLIKEATEAKDAEELNSRVANLRKTVKKNHETKETVTLLVDPVDAQKIVLSQEIGTVFLALCPAMDTKSLASPPPINGKTMLEIKEEIYLPRQWGEIRGATRN